jgi:hypothetical protein
MNTSPTAASATDCKERPLLFQDLCSRHVVADFSGGMLFSDGGGALLLRQVDINLGLTHSVAQCFCDTRQQVYVDHSVRQLLAQRLYGLALGYEDLNDHQRLRLDPLLAAACEKLDPLGQDRCNPEHRGVALAEPARSTAWNRPTTRIRAGTSWSMIRAGSKPACGKWEDADCPNTPRRSWWIWTPWGIGCTGCRKAGIIGPIMTSIAPCRSRSLSATFRYGRNCARATRMEPTEFLASNQRRLWLASLAYLLLERMRALGLVGTDLAQATAGSVRLKLLKVAGQVRVSVRRVYVQLSTAYPGRPSAGCAIDGSWR